MNKTIFKIKKLFYYTHIYGAREIYRLRKVRKNKPYKCNDYVQYLKKNAVHSETLANQRKYKPKNNINFLICVLDAGVTKQGEAGDYDASDADVIERDLSAVRTNLSRSSFTAFDVCEFDALERNVESGDYTHVVFMNVRDRLTDDALYAYASLFDNDRICDMVYADSDFYSEFWKLDGSKVNEDEYIPVREVEKHSFRPYFKPDFSPDYLEEFNYIRLGFAARVEIVKKGMEKGFFRNAHDVLLCLTEAANSIELPEGGSRNIVHIPRVLFHEFDGTVTAEEAEELRLSFGVIPGSPVVSHQMSDEDMAAIMRHYERLGEDGEVVIGRASGTYHFTKELEREPKVSIIVPNMNHLEDLKRCMESFEKSTYTNVEWIIVENNSTDGELFDYYAKISKRDDVKVIYYREDFNFSRICNVGVEEASGELLLFLNNDTEMIGADSLREMVGTVSRDGVGIVGARLLYPDETIQHAGVTMAVGGFACHSSAYIGADEPGYMNRAVVSTDVSAVTAACMLMKKSIFEEVGGYDEKYAVAANDVDLCMKVLHEGYRIVYNAAAEFTHFESKSRGDDRKNDAKARRLQGEVDRFAEKWKDVLVNGDRYYNVNFSRGLEYRLALKEQEWHRSYFWR